MAFYPIDTNVNYVEVGTSCAVSTTPQALLLLRHATTSFTSWWSLLEHVSWPPQLQESMQEEATAPSLLRFLCHQSYVNHV